MKALYSSPRLMRFLWKQRPVLIHATVYGPPGSAAPDDQSWPQPRRLLCLKQTRELASRTAGLLHLSFWAILAWTMTSVEKAEPDSVKQMRIRA
jgi:hypothetical protein